MKPASNILLLNYEFPPLGGGAANATLFIARALAQLGHRPIVVTSGLGRAQSREENDGMVVYRLRTGRAAADRATVGDMIRYAFGGVKSAAAIARAEHCEAAIAFFTIPSGLIARWLRFRLGLPYIVSLRGSDVPGHDITLNRMHAVTRAVRRAVLRGAKAIVANSESLARTSRQADPFPVQVVSNGVDCDRFQPSKQPRIEGPFRILFVGRVHREKNLAAVIEQLPLLSNSVLFVAGDGAQREELFRRSIELGVGERICWLGWQDKAALPALYQSADVLVNPSLYEGMPNVVLEAMATGLPVVASDTPGNRSVVQEGKTGLLFPLDRTSEMANALRRLEIDGAMRSRMGREGRRLAETEYSWGKAAQSYLELLSVALPVSPRS